MDFDSYIDDGENYEDGKPHLVEDYGGYKIGKPVEEFFKLLEIEKQSLEETVEITGFEEESVEKAKKYYAEHYEEFNEEVDSGFEFDLAEDPELPVPEDSFDEMIDMLEGPYNRGCEILREASKKDVDKELSIDEIEAVDNGLAARMEKKNGVKGSIIVNLGSENVRISYGFADEDETYNQQILAEKSKGVEAALNFSFGIYAQLVENNK